MQYESTKHGNVGCMGPGKTDVSTTHLVVKASVSEFVFLTLEVDE